MLAPPFRMVVTSILVVAHHPEWWWWHHHHIGSGLLAWELAGTLDNDNRSTTWGRQHVPTAFRHYMGKGMGTASKEFSDFQVHLWILVLDLFHLELVENMQHNDTQFLMVVRYQNSVPPNKAMETIR